MTGTIVVLQQGPSSLDLSRDTLVLAARLLDPYIRAAGGRSALLMVWPESTRFEFFDEMGTYLAALVVFEGITGRDARSLLAEAVVGGRTLSLPPGRVRLLQRAAHEAVGRFHGQ